MTDTIKCVILETWEDFERTNLNIFVVIFVKKEQECQLDIVDIKISVIGKNMNQIFKHGTPSGYKNYKCKCDACRAAWAAYQGPRVKKWRRKKREELRSDI